MRRRLGVLLLAAALAPAAWAEGRGGVQAATVSPVVPAASDLPAGPYIVQLHAGTDVDAFLSDAGIAPASTMRFSEVFDGFAAVLTQEQARLVAADPRTAGVDADVPVRTMVDQSISPTGPNNNWGLDRIDQRGSTLNGTYSYDAARDGTGVKAYVLDTGVYAAHSEFGGRVTAGWSYRAQTYFFNVQSDHGGVAPLSDSFLGVTPGSDWCTTTGHPYNDGDLDAYDRTYTPAADGTTDNHGHGTHVAGIIAGTTLGVAKDATIVPVQALNSCGTGIASMVVKAIEWILSDHTGSNKAVVNMSLGFDSTVNSIDCVIHGPQPSIGKTCSGYTNWLFKEGIIAVAASGNAGVEDCTASPGSTYGTIAVGASGASVSSAFVADAEPSYTNYGRCTDMFAPGSFVKSAWTATSGSPVAVKSGSSMAAPHVTGVVAGWLESQTAPGTLSTWPTLAWQHIKRTATCGAVTYYDASRTYLTPNRLLYAGTDVSVPCAPASVTAVAGNAQAVVTWKEVAAGNGADATSYTVTSSGGQTCSPSSLTADANGNLTCTLTGLTNNTTYTVSVAATNSAGPGAAATTTVTLGTPPTTTVAPATTVAPTTTVPEAPVAPSSASSASGDRAVTVSWPAINATGTVTYVVTATPGGYTCTTTGTTCTFIGLANGTNYVFTIATKNSAGAVSSSTVTVSARPGFVVYVTKVKRSSRTSLARMVGTVSKGTRTYRVTSGKCRIVSGRLVAPAATGTCKVRVSVARKSPYAAMSTTFSVSVTK